MTGSDGTTLLYDPRSGSYMRLGKQMVKLLPAFDGRRSGTEIVLELSDRWEVPRDTLRLRLGATLKDLAEAGVFEGYEPRRSPTGLIWPPGPVASRWAGSRCCPNRR